jgi:DNA-directed RNA polymerase specialized sigma24 family protein
VPAHRRQPWRCGRLAHDTFVEAYLKIGTLRQPDSLGGWLRAIALNLCRMWCRRRRLTWGELPDDIPAGDPERRSNRNRHLPERALSSPVSREETTLKP